MASRSTLTQRGYSFVVATDAERIAYWKRQGMLDSGLITPEAALRLNIPVDRVLCVATGKRIWASGLGIGSHQRACTASHYIAATTPWRS